MSRKRKHRNLCHNILQKKIVIGNITQNKINVFSRSLSIICFNEVGAVLHIARMIPNKNPRIIPNITIFTVAFRPSQRLSLVGSTNSVKLLKSIISKPTGLSSPHFQYKISFHYLLQLYL